MKNSEPFCFFNKTKNALRMRGFTIGAAQPYEKLLIADVNFSHIQSGEIQFEKDGIFYINPITGIRHQVFLYKRDYYLSYGGEQNKPKMHIRNCQTIQNFGKELYRRANTGTVIVFDKSQRKDVEVSGLEICGYCFNMIKNENFSSTPQTSNDFEKLLKQAAEETETDLNGYIYSWEKISKAYREKMNYTCEKCGYQAKTFSEKFHIHVHHKDGNKLNNNKNNFQCLCIACHASVDERHKENFSNSENLKKFTMLEKIPMPITLHKIK